MKLHWSPRSPFVRKVMIVLHETGQVGDVQYVRNAVAMNQPNAAVMADNPLSKLPTLVLDNGDALFDSHVIAEYFDRRHRGAKLFPAEQGAYFKALTWQALGDGLLENLLLWRNWATERGQDALAGTDTYTRAFALKTNTTLDHLENIASELGATPFNIGHVTIGTLLSYLDFRWAKLDWRAKHPRLAAWHEGFEARPSIIATRISDDDALPVAAKGHSA